MATDKSFAAYIWQKMGPTCREHVRESWDLIERAPPEDRVRLLACFYWANWCRGRADQASGRETYWDMR
ncbi:MAG: hypothetical protein L3K07_04145 [Thermoplasmata archaeon]|nr:hypothetical protein [Thermoplasmata archaeon]